MQDDRSIDSVRGSYLSIPILIGLVALVSVPHWWLWDANPLSAVLNATSLWLFVLVFVGSIVIHEAIHGLTWVIAGRLRFSDVKFGILWRAFTPYAHPRVPLPARAYRIGAAMPGVVMALSGWGAIFLSEASGDLLILIRLRGVPGDVLVQDHPTRFGCEVVGQVDFDRK